VDRLFLRANVLFSAAYREDSGLLRFWKLEHAELITSAYALEEAHRNLDTEEQRGRLEALIRDIRVAPESAVELPDGIELAAKDIPILRAAVGAEASHLITGDRRDFGRHFGKTLAGVVVMPPRDYLAPPSA